MTRKQMYKRVEVIAELLGCTTDHDEAVAQGHDKWLSIDIANGGYMLVFRQVKTWAEWDFYANGRMTNKEFDQYTRGVIAGLERDRLTQRFKG